MPPKTQTSENFAPKHEAGPDLSSEHAKFAKQKSFVEIPLNLNAVSAKELKNILEQLGIKHDDCFEKQDLINRVKEYQNGK